MPTANPTPPTRPADAAVPRALAEIEMRERCAQVCEALDREFSDRLKAACKTNPTVIAAVAAIATTGACLARTIRALPVASASTFALLATAEHHHADTE